MTTALVAMTTAIGMGAAPVAVSASSLPRLHLRLSGGFLTIARVNLRWWSCWLVTQEV